MSQKPSPIEDMFNRACQQATVELGAQVQISRYRTDFVDMERKLVIELDGHEHHKSPEDRTYDAARDRQLQRDGFTVIRFTGREVHRDVRKCVREVQQQLALMQPQPKPAGGVYVDWDFFDRSWVRLQRDHDVGREHKLTLSGFLDALASHCELEGRFNVHLFGRPGAFSESMTAIDALKLRQSYQASFSITEHQVELTATGLTDHFDRHGWEYRQVVLVADDAAYPPLLGGLRPVDVLLRRAEEDSAMLNVPMKRWQDLDYLIGPILGIPMHEL